MEKINCIIVEDTLSDMQLLQHYILAEPSLYLVQSFSNPLEAISCINTSHPNLLFLDIDMPIMNGLDLFKQISYSPICVFVTSHSEYAISSYDLHAFDFILKPVMEKRFNQTISRIHDYLDIIKKADKYQSVVDNGTITIKEGTINYKVPLQNIIYIESLKDYCKIVTKEKKYFVLSTLKKIIDILPTNDFVRVHRSYIISKNKVERFDKEDITLNGVNIPFGKTYKNEVKNLL